MPFRALAPQASASANSATRTCGSLGRLLRGFTIAGDPQPGQLSRSRLPAPTPRPRRTTEAARPHPAAGSPSAASDQPSRPARRTTPTGDQRPQVKATAGAGQGQVRKVGAVVHIEPAAQPGRRHRTSELAQRPAGHPRPACRAPGHRTAPRRPKCTDSADAGSRPASRTRTSASWASPTSPRKASVRCQLSGPTHRRPGPWARTSRIATSQMLDRSRRRGKRDERAHRAEPTRRRPPARPATVAA